MNCSARLGELDSVKEGEFGPKDHLSKSLSFYFFLCKDIIYCAIHCHDGTTGVSRHLFIHSLPVTVLGT